MHQTNNLSAKGSGAQGKRVQKEVYSTPELREYGDLKEITLALNTTHTADGGLLLTLLQLLRTSGLIL